MNSLVNKVVEEARQRGLFPSISEEDNIPLPAINKVELYTTFQCNYKCDHCITNSGPDREESLDPEDAYRAIENISRYSLINGLEDLFGEGRYECEHGDEFKKLEMMRKPPKRLDDELKTMYSDCLQEKDDNSKWYFNDNSYLDLNFSRPSLRLSGGEFYMWPYKIDGEVLSEEERLCYQRDIIKDIREKLPEYDLWILTNGSFADSMEHADEVIGKWAEYGNKKGAPGRTRICVSVDIFHSPPRKSTVEDMVKRIWAASWKHGLRAPFLYGIPNNRIGLLGRAFKKFKVGSIPEGEINNYSRSGFNPVSDVVVDPVDLVSTQGCREVKGFYLSHGDSGLMVNNVVISPMGRLVYCCACLGDYGDFINEPCESLKKLIIDPVTLMLRRRETVVPLFNLAVLMDPTIEIFGSGEYPAVTASTCYQMMTGVRV